MRRPVFLGGPCGPRDRTRTPPIGSGGQTPGRSVEGGPSAHRSRCRRMSEPRGRARSRDWRSTEPVGAHDRRSGRQTGETRPVGLGRRDKRSVYAAWGNPWWMRAAVPTSRRDPVLGVFPDLLSHSPGPAPGFFHPRNVPLLGGRSESAQPAGRTHGSVASRRATLLHGVRRSSLPGVRGRWGARAKLGRNRGAAVGSRAANPIAIGNIVNGEGRSSPPPRTSAWTSGPARRLTTCGGLLGTTMPGADSEQGPVLPGRGLRGPACP